MFGQCQLRSRREEFVEAFSGSASRVSGQRWRTLGGNQDRPVDKKERGVLICRNMMGDEIPTRANVIVQEKDQSPTGGCHACISGGGWPSIRLFNYLEPAPGFKGPEHLNSAVG